jgi:hypothetical protein
MDSGHDMQPWTAACFDTTLVTRIGPVHADHAGLGQAIT